MLTSSPSEGQQRKTLDQISGPLPLAGFEGMEDGFEGLVVLGIPEAGTMVQDGHQIRLRLLKLAGECFSKKGMIAIPLAFAIECHHKYIGLLKPLQHLLIVSLLHDSITERSGEPFKVTGGEQKGSHLLWLLPKHHLGQIVQDVALLATGLL